MSVKVFKMINGEEIISSVTSGGEAGFFLENPATIMVQPTPDGKMGVGIAPYMPYASGKVYLYKSAIASEADPDINMENEYNRVYGSGIQIVGAGAMPTQR